jgi:hypothetical protein
MPCDFIYHLDDLSYHLFKGKPKMFRSLWNKKKKGIYDTLKGGLYG